MFGLLVVESAEADVLLEITARGSIEPTQPLRMNVSTKTPQHTALSVKGPHNLSIELGAEDAVNVPWYEVAIEAVKQ